MQAYLRFTRPDGSESTLVRAPFASCDHCGDDIDVHEWITAQSCDRAEED